MSSDKSIEMLCAIHEDTPRQGPGSRSSTLRALQMVPQLTRRESVLDIGCGTGAQALVLAERMPRARITAVDIYRPFLDSLSERAAAAGLAGRIETRLGDMGALDDPPGSRDLIWAEGSAFVIGFEQALAAWRPLLRRGGVLGLSEVCWFVDEPPPEAAAAWQRWYPGIRPVAHRLEAVEDAGYRLLGHFSLPSSDWTEEYFAPLDARLPALREQFRDDPQGLEVIEDTRYEHDLYREHEGVWGYEMIVAERAGA